MPLGQHMAALFGKNPVKQLRAHFELVQQCCQLLPAFIQASDEADWAKARELQQQIARLESLADDYKTGLYLSLPKRLFTSVPREDLLKIINRQDKVANTAKDIAGLMLGRKIQIPQAIHASYLKVLQSSLDTVDQAKLAIDELDDLLETGFGGRESDLLTDLIKRLDELEHVNDQAQITVRSELFTIEKEMHAIDAIFLYHVIDYTGELADRAQKLGGQLMQLVAR